MQQAGSYLGLNSLIKLVIFEAKRILMSLRPGTGHVPFLGAHRENHNHHALVRGRCKTKTPETTSWSRRLRH